jgi:hypothetical protein
MQRDVGAYSCNLGLYYSFPACRQIRQLSVWYLMKDMDARLRAVCIKGRSQV